MDAALKQLVDAGELVRLKPDVLYPAERYARIREVVLAQVEREGATTIARLRDLLGVSRKYAQAVLEQLDGEKALRRDGDRHVGRQGPGGPSGLQSRQGGATHRLEGSTPSRPRPDRRKDLQ